MCAQAARTHGRRNRIEGRLVPGEKVVVVEDLISTGGSALEAVEALREAGAEVLGIAALFTYGMEKGRRRIAEHNTVAHCLTNFDEVVAAAAEDGAFPASYVPRADGLPGQSRRRQLAGGAQMRHLIDIRDLAQGEIVSLLDLADGIFAHPEDYREACRYKKLATLFFEPSTRTRLSSRPR